MLTVPRDAFFGFDLPEFFHPQAVFLVVGVGEVIARDRLFGERAAHAFGQQHVFAVQHHARRRNCPSACHRGQAHIAGATPRTAPSSLKSSSAAAKPG
jgi:hypothetical protein